MDLSTAQTNYTAALVAYQDALAARSASVGDRSVTYHDVEKLRHEVLYWYRRVQDLTYSSSSNGYSVARWTR